MKIEIQSADRVELLPDELVGFLKECLKRETGRDILEVRVHPDFKVWGLSTMSAILGPETEYSRVYASLLKDSSRRFQDQVQPWMTATFGPEISGDKKERNHRFYEEATELVQAGGMTAAEAHQLVDYTFGRPVGELRQEVGGVMVTLAALCLAQGVNMHSEGEVELERIWGMVEQIRAKQAAKPKFGPLPGLPIKERIQANRDAEAQEAARQAACRRLMAASDATVAMVEAVLDSASKSKVVSRLAQAAGNAGLLGLTATPLGMQAIREGQAVELETARERFRDQTDALARESATRKLADNDLSAQARAAVDTPVFPSATRGLDFVVEWLKKELKDQSTKSFQNDRSSTTACKSLLNELVLAGHAIVVADEPVTTSSHAASAHARMLFLLNDRQEKEDSYTDLVRACETIARYPSGTWRQCLREAAYKNDGTSLCNMAGWVLSSLLNENYKI